MYDTLIKDLDSPMSSPIDVMLAQALSAVLAGDEALRAALDELPAAIYVTDADGLITYFNPACLDFTGRRPEVGEDRWCVTWRLYTNAGEFLPHDQCPMAVAINTQKPIRGVTAVAERPDGTRVNFRPYPTPIFDGENKFMGAVNLLEDVTDEVRADDLLAQARRCRRLANAVADVIATETLNRMADEYEAKAADILTSCRSRSLA
ncbi:MAG TPA: PAS domain S-box protein [Caulobacteraceae bacterium]|jgi:PAS domain S-box-containing protein|nr:PAS domain S-box protein [Caulobacteraceae bacterium]